MVCYILPRKEKIKGVGLILLLTVGALLESIGITLIIPVISSIMTPELFMNYELVKKICGILGISDSNSFIVFMLVLMIFVFIIKNLYILFMYNMVNKYIYKNKIAFMEKLFYEYLNKPYEYHLNVNSSVIQRTLTVDIAQTFAIILQLFQIFSESLVLLVITSLLFIVDVQMTIILVIALLACLIIVKKVMTPKLENLGKVAQKSNGLLLSWINQSMMGIKEVKVMKKESFFDKRLLDYGKEYGRAQRIYDVMAQTPRLLIETISICGGLGGLMFGIICGVDLNSMVSVTAAFLLALVRMMPSVNRLTVGVNTIAFNYSSLVTIYQDLKKDSEIKLDLKKKLITEKEYFNKDVDCIQINEISYRYPDAATDVLQKVSFQLYKGQAVALIGKSGEGKTTFLNLLLGLLIPTSGTIESDGQNVFDNLDEWQPKIGYIPQNIFLLDGSIRDNICFGLEKEAIDEKRIYEVLKQTQLFEFVNSLPDGLNTMVGEQGTKLSGGQRQRIGIARALYHHSSVLILDEATSGLDSVTEEQIMNAVYQLKENHIVLMVAHKLNTIEGCDKVYRIKGGRIYQQ